MNKRKIALGPGAASLILIVVVLSLCMLAMLTMISARNDNNLSVRSVSSVEQVYELSSKCEESLSRLDAILADNIRQGLSGDEYLNAVSEQLPEEMILEDDLVSWIEETEGRTMECAVRVLSDGNGPRYEWVSHRLLVEEAGEEFDE